MRRGVLFQAEGIAQGSPKQGFPRGSDDKDSAFNARDPDSIPGWEDSLEKGMATHSRILAWRIPMDRGVWQAPVHGVAKGQTRLSN